MKSRVLVIDDEENIRFTLERFLSAEGYDAVTAVGYEDAVGKMVETDFDLVFADIILKGKTGIDVLKEVKKKNPQCPVVLFTGAPSIETAAEAVRLGAFDYIPKPVKQQTLLRVARIALQYKGLVEEKERYRRNLEAIFRSVKDGIITVDKAMKVVELNEAAQNICGLSNGDAQGKPFDSIKKDCASKCLEAVRESIRKKKTVERHRIECNHKKRFDQVVTLTTSPLMDRRKAFSGVVIVIRDETRLVELERSLEERCGFENLIGISKGMRKIYSLIDALKDVETTVLITGKSGTGKELVAEAIHHRGERCNMPLVKVNCSALSESLIESEMFGHVKGAFTGAVKDKTGRFERADKGSIFLDEIGDMPPRMQVQLLRVLEEKRFERVGDATPLKVDARILAATNRDLREEVERGRFREDLYYRIRVMELRLPPLTERREDIPLLTTHFLKQFSDKFGKEITDISGDVRKIFLEYPWPGNVRELEHALEHAHLLCNGSIITVEHLPPELKTFGLRYKENGDYEAIIEALEKTRWNKTEAARLLGVSRQTLYRKIREYKIAIH